MEKNRISHKIKSYANASVKLSIIALTANVILSLYEKKLAEKIYSSLLEPVINGTILVTFFLIFLATSASISLWGISKVEPLAGAQNTNLLNELGRDPLHITTRKSRRNLLIVSLVALAMSIAGIVPTKIQAIGLETDDLDPQKIIIFSGIVTIYLLFSFAFYVRADLVNCLIHAPFLNNDVKRTMFFRLTFEIATPIVFACIALTSLYAVSTWSPY